MRAIMPVAAVMGLASVAPAATLLSSFENSFTGTREAYTSFSSTTGVSDGSYSLDIAVPTPTLDPGDGNYKLYIQPFKANVDYSLLINAPDKRLAIDITMPVAPTGSWWWEIQMVLNAQSPFGYQQSPKLNANANAIATPTTLVWDYSAVDFSTLPANPTYQEVVLVINAGGPASFVQAPHVYADNLRVVPEPSSLVFLGAAAVLIRRRRG